MLSSILLSWWHNLSDAASACTKSLAAIWSDWSAYHGFIGRCRQSRVARIDVVAHDATGARSWAGTLGADRDATIVAGICRYLAAIVVLIRTVGQLAQRIKSSGRVFARRDVWASVCVVARDRAGRKLPIVATGRVHGDATL